MEGTSFNISDGSKRKSIKFGTHEEFITALRELFDFLINSTSNYYGVDLVADGQVFITTYINRHAPKETLLSLFTALYGDFPVNDKIGI